MKAKIEKTYEVSVSNQFGIQSVGYYLGTTKAQAIATAKSDFANKRERGAWSAREVTYSAAR
jgi:lipoprotein NlpI